MAPGTPPDQPSTSWTLRRSLERQRLVARVRRLERVVAALQLRADAHPSGRDVPAPLRLALRDFRRELADVRRQLAGIETGLRHLAPSGR
jgi:hypothetical protein